jgi:hypothetical protein
LARRCLFKGLLDHNLLEGWPADSIRKRSCLTNRTFEEFRTADSGLMQVNEMLTDIIRGRTIELVTKEEGLVTIVFNDRSTMRVKVTGGPTMNMLGESRTESVKEDGTDLILFGENDRRAILRLAAPGSSITVENKDGVVEYEG